MIIDNKEYSTEFVKKAIIFYTALLTGEIAQQLKEELKND